MAPCALCSTPRPENHVMRSFAEQYRPATLADFLGNPKAVQAAEFYLRRGLGGLAF